MKNIGVIGIGRLGLCFSLILEKAGYDVLGLDIKNDYINQINDKTFVSYEKDVNNFLKESQNFKATTNLEEVINFSDIFFVILRTESLSNGKYDHSQIESFLKQLIALGKTNVSKNLVICSNVCPGYSDEIQKRLVKYNYVVSFNPEWVAQGSILHDYLYPDLVVIGGANKKSGDIIEEVYKNICLNNPPIHRMDRLSGEITKVGLNCFLITKLSYANMLGEIAIKSGVDPEPILAAIGEDTRINSKYFKYGFGYGGPCFSRDVRALIYYGNKIGLCPAIIKAVIETNDNHLKFQLEEFFKNHDKNEPVILNSITYKPGTVIIEESQQLSYAVCISKSGYKVIIEEHKEVIKQIKEKYGDLFIYRERK